MEQTLQHILDRSIDQKKIFGTAFALKKGEHIWKGAAGDLTTESAFFIASTTKLFTTVLILQLRNENKLNLHDPINNFLDPNILDGLHLFKGIDYSRDLTIQHLLAHTSGLPDYFQDKGTSGISLEDQIKQGNDQAWTFEQVVERTKLMKPLFAPGTVGIAHYSDANFQLLGKIIEEITAKPYAQNCQDRIIRPLGLSQTYLYVDSTDSKPKSLYYKKSPLVIPKAMTSFGPDGGMVSTCGELLTFIEAFFNGSLFPKSYLDELMIWNKIFFPMQSGIGIHLFKLPWYFDPFGAVPAFIGHSGLSGALAYYCPKENIYIAGTVNQVGHPDLSFRTMITLVRKFAKA